MRQLPPNLLDLILVILEDDLPSIQRCSLVCKFWTMPSQRLLFHKHTVIIEGRSFPPKRKQKQAATVVNDDMNITRPKPSALRFVETFRNSLRAPVHIVSVQYHLGDAALDLRPPIARDYMRDDQNFAMIEVLAPLLESKLTRLRTLKLLYANDSGSSHSMLLKDVSPALAVNLPAIARLEIFRVRFSNFYSFQCFLCSFPQLRSLSLIGAWWHDIGVHGSSNHAIPPTSLNLNDLTVDIHRRSKPATKKKPQTVRHQQFLEWISTTTTIQTLTKLVWASHHKCPGLDQFLNTTPAFPGIELHVMDSTWRTCLCITTHPCKY
jgi:hypothetical protein